MSREFPVASSLCRCVCFVCSKVLATTPFAQTSRRCVPLTRAPKQVVEAVVRDSDVQDAVQAVASHTHALRLTHHEAASFQALDSELGPPDGAAATAGSELHSSQGVSPLLTAVGEAVVLLEAVAMSRRLSRLIVDARGVVELVRCLSTVAHLRPSTAAAPSSSSSAPGLASTAMSALATSRGAKTGTLAAKMLKSAVSTVITNSRRASTVVVSEEQTMVRCCLPWCGFGRLGGSRRCRGVSNI